MPSSVRRVLVVLGLVAVPAAIAAQDSVALTDARTAHVRAAERLLEVTDAERLNALMIQQMQSAQLAQTPQLAPYADLMQEFFAEHMSWDKVRPETMQLYMEVFTTAELEELITFYQSPLGRKLLAKSPEIMTRAMVLSQRRLQAAMPLLLERVQERAAKSVAAPPGRP